MCNLCMFLLRVKLLANVRGHLSQENLLFSLFETDPTSLSQTLLPLWNFFMCLLRVKLLAYAKRHFSQENFFFLCVWYKSYFSFNFLWVSIHMALHILMHNFFLTNLTFLLYEIHIWFSMSFIMFSQGTFFSKHLSHWLHLKDKLNLFGQNCRSCIFSICLDENCLLFLTISPRILFVIICVDSLNMCS